MELYEAITCASRGRILDTPPPPNMSKWQQTLELGGDISNTLSTVLKDSYVLLKYEDINMEDNHTEFYKEIRKHFANLKERYGTYNVRRAAAEIWKITAAEKERIADENGLDDIVNVPLGTVASVTQECCDGIEDLFCEWEDKFTQEEKDFISEHIIQRLQGYVDNPSPDTVEFLNDLTVVRLRIRKLTPRECGRLMGLTEDEIDRIEASGISMSQQYRLYGNAIVVDNMTYIYQSLFGEEQQRKYRYGEQLTIF